MNAREEERKRVLQACMAVVKKEDSKARRRPETHEKSDPKTKLQTPSSSSQTKSLSMSSSISKPTLTITTSSLPKKVAPVIKKNSTSFDARKARPADSNRKSSTDAGTGKRPKQPAPTKPKSVKSKTPTPISVSEVSGASNTLDNIPDSLQPISESTGTATFTGEDEIEIEEVEEFPSQANKNTSGGSLSIKSILKTISSMHKLPTSAPEPKLTEPQSDSLNKSEETSSAGTSSVVRKGILKTRAVSNFDASQLTYSSQEISREKPNSATGHNLYYTEEEYIPKPGHRTAKRLSKSKSLRTLGIEDFPEVFMSRLSDPKRPPSASSALSVSSNRLRSIKSSHSQKGLPRKEKKKADKAGTSAARDNELKLAVVVPNIKDKRAMSLKDIVVAEKKKFDARNKRSSMYAKKSSKSRLLDTEPSQEFVSALKSELKSIQENFIAVTDAEQPPVPFTDKFSRENLMMGKREPSTLPKYDIPLPDIEHPYVPPPPFKCAPGINYTPFPQRPIVHQPYYGQPYYDPSGRVLEPEEIGPVGRFVSEILASNVRLVDAAFTAAREMGQFDAPAAQRLLEQFQRRPLRSVVRLSSTDIDTTQLQAEMADEEEFERQARSNMEMERLSSERMRLERREERREREQGILEFDPEAMKHEHRRLEQDKERRNRERERLSRARERWEDERMEHERKRLEREENLFREKKAEEAALALQRKEEDRTKRRSSSQPKSGKH